PLVPPTTPATGTDGCTRRSAARLPPRRRRRGHPGPDHPARAAPPARTVSPRPRTELLRPIITITDPATRLRRPTGRGLPAELGIKDQIQGPCDWTRPSCCRWPAPSSPARRNDQVT